MAFADASPRIILDAYGIVNIPNGTSNIVKVGDPISFNGGATRWTPQDENSFTLYALEDAAKSETFAAAVGAVITGFTGGTAGSALYNAGGGVWTDASSSNDIHGYMVTATTAIVGPSTLAV